MGNIDTITKDYMRKPEILSDAFNMLLYKGEQVIKPEALRELDTTEIAIPYQEGKAGAATQKYRDVVKLWEAVTDDEAIYLIFGIENESKVNYAMPVKNALYDIMQLSGQVKAIADRHKKDMKAGAHKPDSDDEFLSGFWKDDKLIPVITLVVYFGPDEWDGPMKLSDMYSVRHPALLEYAPEYKINLIAPAHMKDEDFELFHSELREVLYFIKHSGSREGIAKISENERYKNVHRDTVDVINATTRSNIDYPKGEERVDMCTGLQELLADKMTEGITVGRQEGITVGRQEGITVGRQEGITVGRQEERIYIANQAEELRKQGKSADEILNIILSTTIQSV